MNIEYFRNKIKNNGYMTETQITLELSKNEEDFKNLKEILKSIIGNGFYKIKYTNRYVAPYKTKNLFYYNPNIKSKKKKINKKQLKTGK